MVALHTLPPALDAYACCTSHPALLTLLTLLTLSLNLSACPTDPTDTDTALSRLVEPDESERPACFALP